jgi:hypothetical protein
MSVSAELTSQQTKPRTFVWTVHLLNDAVKAVRAGGIVVTDSGDLLFYSSGRIPIQGWAAGEWVSFVKNKDID